MMFLVQCALFHVGAKGFESLAFSVEKNSKCERGARSGLTPSKRAKRSLDGINMVLYGLQYNWLRGKSREHVTKCPTSIRTEDEH